MEIKIIPLFPRKSRKNQDEAIMDLDPLLRRLEEQYLMLVARELRAVRYSKTHQGENSRTVCKLMNAYYGLGIVRNVLEDLRDVRTGHELCQMVREMCMELKMLNRISGPAMEELVDEEIADRLAEGEEVESCLLADKERFQKPLFPPEELESMDDEHFENAALENELNSTIEYVENLEKEL